MLDTRHIHSLSDFVRNPKAHVARLKETRTPEVLTVNGRAEVVLLDTETYEDLMERIRSIEEIAHVRAVIREAKCAGPREEISEAEMERRESVMKELMEETERLGLYR
jgi:PHD/YefM family antitoxin component YafN of YafNO toxin-antitoxin module